MNTQKMNREKRTKGKDKKKKANEGSTHRRSVAKVKMHPTQGAMKALLIMGKEAISLCFSL